MTSFPETSQWHTGEDAMHKLMHVPYIENPTSPFLAPYASDILMSSPLIALGTLDSHGWPWTTLWGGEAGFARPIAQSVMGLRTTVARVHDPVLKILLGDKADGEVIQVQGTGKMVGGLGINLETRRRVKLFGRMVAGVVEGMEEGIGEVQLVVRIEQSLGNCPKYLNRKHIIPHKPEPKLISTGLPLPKAALDLIEKADLFFISSSNHESDMDTNHRGGPPGFIRILPSSTTDNKTITLVYPEYSGNRLYQTLGNLQSKPQAGLVIPDFLTGDVLYITGTTEILAGRAASDLISHTNLAVKIKVHDARFVANALAFRGIEGAFSPYNPPIRHLLSEKTLGVPSGDATMTARLIAKTILTPTIVRFRFRLSSSPSTNTSITTTESGRAWKAGQYVALSFQDELDIGYSHMREDDPASLNDDFLRTFTVSSPPPPLSSTSTSSPEEEFEVTIRKHGPVTHFLFSTNPKSGLEVPMRGFGGEFFMEQDEGEKIAFAAAGVGITPLLAQAHTLDLERLNLYWTLKIEDIGFAVDTFKRIPGLAASTKLFVTGGKGEVNLLLAGELAKLGSIGLKGVYRERMSRDVVLGGGKNGEGGVKAVGKGEDGEIKRWYVCTGPGMKTEVLRWLEGKEVHFEDFNY